MSPKHGILHDYDLAANREPSAQEQECIVCGARPMSFQWSDFSGEGMCTKCGTPYQLKWGSPVQQANSRYPYLNLNPLWIPVVWRYHAETGRFTYLGTGLGYKPGLSEFYEWVDEHGLAPAETAGTPPEELPKAQRPADLV